MKSTVLITILAVLGLFLCQGCASVAPQSSLNHTYVTSMSDTQYSLTGIELYWNEDVIENSIDQAAAMGLTLSVFKNEYLVDGRVAASHLVNHKFKTFIQLPPGKHLFVARRVVQGVSTLFGKSSTVYDSYIISVAEGKTAKINGWDAINGHCERFKNLEWYRKLPKK